MLPRRKESKGDRDLTDRDGAGAAVPGDEAADHPRSAEYARRAKANSYQYQLDNTYNACFEEGGQKNYNYKP
jgi:hypothetical protein